MKPVARAGVWQVDCETCRVPVQVELNQEQFACRNGQVLQDGTTLAVCPDYDKPKNIDWPKDIDDIEKLLRKAKPEEQYYHSIWTAKEFEKVLNDPNHVVGP